MEILPLQSFEAIKLVQMLADKSMTNSYKIFWLRGIIDSAIEGKTVVNIEDNVIKMISEAWYPVTQYKLSLGKLDKIEEIIGEVLKRDPGAAIRNKDDLADTIKSFGAADFRSKINRLARYVTFRLLTPFYAEQLRGLSDHDKNRKIQELSQGDQDALYRISSKGTSLYINDRWATFIQKNRQVISGWSDHVLINYLQRRNPNVPAIPLKIFPPMKRDLSKAKRFWGLVQENVELMDIYTKRPMTSQHTLELGEISIDHFVPWSFVQHDLVWNLIPTFKRINSMKSNHVPNLNKYLDDFCIVQYKAVNCMINTGMHKYLEDYYTVDQKMVEMLTRRSNFEKKDFIAALKRTIEPQVQIATNQGFLEWEYIDD
ncbi:HNH endonuclease domain-containing protein [Anoxynatronum sibiricum]|uniref:HNH endonuclease domain-containing protein n=1 Tax=Anoxynatronum sibiricum TaxID=210623 RepID=A0ABU9VWB9_9CLOT